MSKKVKVKINATPPSPQRIKKYKNYNNFMQQYQDIHSQKGIREMWYRKKTTLSFIMVIVAVLLIFLWRWVENN